MRPDNNPGIFAKRSFNALKWNYVGNAARAASQLVIGVVLARLLGPEAFGTVAVGWLVVGAGMLIADLGFGAALVQRRDLTEQDICFVFTMQVSLGALLTVTGVALGGPIAEFFHRPEAGAVVRTMALLFLIQSFGQAPLSLLRRSLDFKRAQSVTVTSYLVGYLVIGIPCAYFGFGAWSLVFAHLVQSALSSILAIRRSGFLMRPNFTRVHPGLFSFGSQVIGANLSNWGISNIDSVIVGRALGVVDLGLYTRAMTLVASPAGAVISGLQGVLFAAGSRAQADTVTVKRAYLAATAAVGMICFPVFMSVSAVAETVVAAVYGPKWAAVAPVLVPLALAMPVSAVLGVVGPVLTAMNRVTTELRVQAFTLLIMLPVLFSLSRFSLGAVAWGILAVYLLRCVLLVRSLLAPLDATRNDVLRVLAWPALCGSLTALATWSADQLIGDLAPWLRLLVDTAVGMISLLLIVRLFRKRLLDGPHGEFLLATGRLPNVVRQLLGV